LIEKEITCGEECNKAALKVGENYIEKLLFSPV
jgi:hypothetical protein